MFCEFAGVSTELTLAQKTEGAAGMANVPYLVPGDVWNLFLTLLEGSQVHRVQGNKEVKALKRCLDS